MALDRDQVTVSVSSPENGTAAEEVPAEYSSAPLGEAVSKLSLTCDALSPLHPQGAKDGCPGTKGSTKEAENIARVWRVSSCDDEASGGCTTRERKDNSFDELLEIDFHEETLPQAKVDVEHRGAVA
jgi:hypothetical protein